MPLPVLQPLLAPTRAAAITAAGDDGNYGSAATLDVLVLQALSTRIHYGKFVAEAKFRCGAATGAAAAAHTPLVCLVRPRPIWLCGPLILPATPSPPTLPGRGPRTTPR